MAKAYFTCSRCGGKGTVLAQSGKQAESRAQWLQSKGALCDDCNAADRQQQAESSAAAAEAKGLPILKGSEKQVAWAETLRADYLQKLGYIQSLLQGDELPTNLAPHHLVYMRQEHAQIADLIGTDLETWQLFVEVVSEQDEARWWIDNRGAHPSRLIFELRDAMLARRASAEVPTAEAAEHAEAFVLRPAAEPASPHVADIGWNGRLMIASLPARDERFREVMRANRLRWAAGRWELILGESSGAIADRAAELAHALLAAGFMVRLADDEARRLAVDGTFEPEHRHWFHAVTSGNFSGWLVASWPKGDDFYHALRCISGCRIHQGRLHFPASSADELEDFAAAHGFRFSASAQRLVDEYRAAIAGCVAVEPRAQRTHRAAQPFSVPAPLAVPEQVEVDDDLLDRD